MVSHHYPQILHKIGISHAETFCALFFPSRLVDPRHHKLIPVEKYPDSMRPQIDRPNVLDLSDRIERLIESSSEDDFSSYKRLVAMQTIFVEGYQSLMIMNRSISYSDWAGYAMVLVTKCGGVIMKGKLMGELYDVIYSLFCGYAGGALVTSETRARFSPKYRSSSTTYKDVYDISVDFSTSFGSFNDVFTHWKDNLGAEDCVDQICLRDVNANTRSLQGYPSLKSHETGLHEHQTVDFICSYLWNAARTNYFKLKYLGLEKWDYDVVFQYENPPFPEHVFYDLLGRFENYCRWLPVGEVGLFSDDLVRANGLQFSLDTLDSLVTSSGVSKASWQCYLLLAKSHTDINLPSPFTEPRFAALKGQVDVGDDKAFDPTEEVLRMGRLSYHPREAAEYVGQELHRYRVLNQKFLRSMGGLSDETIVKEELFNAKDLSPEMYDEIKRDIYTFEDFGQLFQMEFNTIPLCITGKFVKPSKSPLARDAQGMQETKEYMFFKELLESGTGDVSGGLFIQSCIDFANKFDPPVVKKKGDWADWKVVANMDHPKAFINDTRLFMSIADMKTEDQKCTLKGQSYDVTASGSVCYGYDPQGEPLVVSAMFCEGMGDNILSYDCFKNVRGALYRDPSSGIVQLPVLTIQEEKVAWRGYEITSFDVDYWHERFNHMDVAGLKRYAQVIRGMPPYFWPFKLGCTECPRHTEISEEEEEEEEDY